MDAWRLPDRLWAMLEPLPPDRRVAERAHAHLGAFRAVRTRWCRLLRSYEAFLATAAAHRIVKQAVL